MKYTGRYICILEAYLDFGGRKRTAARQRIERYYFQLKEGCGKSDCSNTNCASSPNFAFQDISNNDAGVKAIELFRMNAILCDSKPCKMARNCDNETESRQDTVGTSSTDVHSTEETTPSTSSAPQPSTSQDHTSGNVVEAVGCSDEPDQNQAGDAMASGASLVEALDKILFNFKNVAEEPKLESLGTCIYCCILTCT